MLRSGGEPNPKYPVDEEAQSFHLQQEGNTAACQGNKYFAFHDK